MTAAWLLTFWLFAVGWFCCCAEEPLYVDCEYCTDDLCPRTMSVYVPPLADVLCTNCAGFGGTYIVEDDPISSCILQLVVDDDPCGGDSFHVILWVLSDRIRVELEHRYSGAIVNIYTYEYAGTSPFDCTTFDDLALPYVSQYYTPSSPFPPFYTATCDASAAGDVLVSAL